jgi:hypothetical protein
LQAGEKTTRKTRRDYRVGSQADVDTREGTRKEAWIADFTDGAGKRHIQTFQQKKKANAYEAEIRVDVGSGTHACAAGRKKASRLRGVIERAVGVS